MKNPCYGCTKRFLGCHDKCPEYTEWRAANDKANATRRMDGVLWEHVKKVHERIMKGAWRKR